MELPAQAGKTLSLLILVISLSALVLSGCSKTASSSITITQPAPSATVTLSISPQAVTPGESATLSWSSANANSCTASGAWSGTLGTSGSTTVQLQGASAQTYKLTCSGAGLPGENTATLALSPEQGACAVGAAVRAHGKRAAHRSKPVGTHS